MSNHSIKTISENFKMTAFGVSFEDWNDWAGNAAKTAAKIAEITENGKLAELLALADGQEYHINYVIDGKAWRGFGVLETSTSCSIALPNEQRAATAQHLLPCLSPPIRVPRGHSVIPLPPS